MNDDTYIPPRYSNNMNKDKKNLAKKRTLFRKKAKNFFIKNNRLYYKYNKNNIETIICKIPFKEEVYPLVKYISIIFALLILYAMKS